MIQPYDCIITKKVRLNCTPSYSDGPVKGDIGTVFQHPHFDGDVVTVRFQRVIMGVLMDDLDLVEVNEK